MPPKLDRQGLGFSDTLNPGNGKCAAGHLIWHNLCCAESQDAFGGARGPVADALNLNAGVALAAAMVAADAREGVAMAQEAQRRCELG